MRRVLHFMADIQVSSGMAAVVMNYYRHIDRSRVQFDFLYFEDGPLSYEQEIRSLGGRTFRIPRPGPLSMGNIHAFFRAHQGGIPDSPLSSHLVGRSFGTCCQALWRPSRLSAQPQ